MTHDDLIARADKWLSEPGVHEEQPRALIDDLAARVRELEADNTRLVIIGKREHELTERAEAERDALRALLTDISNTVLLTCENVHHAKSEQNHAISECPVVTRLVTAIDAALSDKT